jgi:hypothetical protein
MGRSGCSLAGLNWLGAKSPAIELRMQSTHLCIEDQRTIILGDTRATIQR